MERSAEWLRGAVHVLAEVLDSHPASLMTYCTLLSAAEAREAAQPSAAEVKGIAAWLSDNHARTKDGKLCCVEVRRPDTHGGLCCTWKMKDFDIQAEMDGPEVGEEIVLRYVELTDAEFTALGDFDGW